MIDAGSIVYKITADVAQLKNALSESGKAVAGLDQNMRKNGENIGEKLLSGIKSVITVGAIAKFLNDTITAGANLQQSIGGIETLFGAKGADSVQEYANIVGKSVEEVSGEYEKLKQVEAKMLANADMAWKNQGVSANKYMETVTSFSASLLQGLDGDTEKASAIADRIMTDMSDNANKFGTDISSIQNAYQGFAKQNYTMLDNLKLGYGGTKSEMERLIQDASKMKDIQEELGITVDASSMSFDNIANAISVMQKNLYITETTAQEAEKTISGSFNAMKSAWENFLAKMALGEDITPALENLIESAVTYLGKNLIPAVVNVLRSLPSAIYGVVMEYLPQFMTYVTEVITSIANDISQNLPTILQKGWELLETLANGIIENLPAILSAIAEIMLSISKAIIQNFPMILQRGIEIIFKLTAGILQTIPNLFSQVRNAFANIDWHSIGSSIINGIVNGIRNGASAVWNAAKSVAQSALNSVKSFLGINSPSKKFMEIGKQVDEGLSQGIDNNVDLVEGSMKGISDMMLDTDLSMGKPNMNSFNSMSGDSNSVNYGGIVINMNVPEGTNATQLVNQMEYELAKRTIRREVVFG